MLSKEEIRRRIWELLERENIATFPRPVYGRIPNFIGSEIAAKRLCELPEFKRANVVKVNPDSPQYFVRKLVLLTGKKLIMPSPKLKRGFLLLDPKFIPPRDISEAATIKGAFKHGRLIRLSDLPSIDLIVIGSVAVDYNGSRIGKGGGYSEIEYAILRELRKISDDTPVITTVHDKQIVDKVPREEHDVPVDVIVTPNRVIRISSKLEKPKGIIWSKIPNDTFGKMPVLKELLQVLNYSDTDVKVI